MPVLLTRFFARMHGKKSALSAPLYFLIALALLALPAATHAATINGTVRKMTDSTGIAGIKVVWINGTTRTDSTVTDSTGFYTLLNVTTGTRTVEASGVGYSTLSNSVNAFNNATTYTSNFYLGAPGSISGTVRKSTDSTVLANASVYLRRTNTTSAILDSAKTDSLGNYAFTNKAPGTPNYFVTVSLTGYVTTSNSNIVLASGAAVVSNVYIAPVLPGSISGTVRKSADSTAVAGAKIYLRRTSTTNPIQDSTVSDGAGAYSFANLTAGTPNYFVTFSAAGLITASNSNIVVNNGANTVSNIYLQALGKIATRVRKLTDSTNIANALVLLRRGTSDTSAILDSGRTDSLGALTFSNLTASGGNNYRVYVTSAGYVSTSLTGLVVTNGTITAANFYLGTPGSISGKVRKSTDSSVVVNASVYLRRTSTTNPVQDSVKTDSLGNFAFANLTPGTPNYFVTASATNFVTGSNSNIVVGSGAAVVSNVYLVPILPGSISGTVRKSADSTTVAGAKIYLRRTSTTNPIQDSTVSDGSGAYAFANLTAGTPNYFLTFSATGLVSASNSNVVVNNGANTVSNIYLVSLGKIAARVRKSTDSTNIANALVLLRRGTSDTSAILDSGRTDSLGALTFSNLTASTGGGGGGATQYRVYASASGYVSVSITAISVTNGLTSNANFYLGTPGSISGKVRKSTDSSNIIGASVYLRRTSTTNPVQDSAKTDSLGNYAFANLTPGTPNYFVTASAANYNTASNSNIVVASGAAVVSNVYLVPILPGSISGTVRKSVDSTVVVGAKIYLRRTSTTNPIQDSTVSDGSGTYAFANLAPGAPNYFLTFSAAGLVTASNSNVVVNNGANTVSNIYLVALGKITARVRKSTDSTNIANALVLLRRGTSDTTAILDSGRTDSLGAITFANLTASTGGGGGGATQYRVYASASGYVSVTNTAISVTNGVTTTTNFYLGTPGSISGTIRKAVDSTVVSGAKVYLRRTSATNPIQDSTVSDGSGAYAFANLNPGTPNYFITASATNLVQGTNSNVVVNSGANTVSTLYLLSLGKITARIRKLSDSTNIANALVLLRRGTSDTTAILDSGRTDSLGAYTFSNLTASTGGGGGGATQYRVYASASGFVSATNTAISVTNGATTTTNFYLGTPGSISGTVRKVTDSTALANAVVYLRRTSATTAILDSAKTDSLGHYAFASVNSGTPNYWITASLATYVSSTNTNVAVASGAAVTSNFYLTLVMPGSITGTVRKLPDSAFVVNALVRLRRGSDTAAIMDTARTDSVGRYTFNNLVAGTPNYWVSALATGLLTGSNANITVPNGGSVTSNFVLSVPGSISGRIRRLPDSLGIRSALVQMRRGGATSAIVDSARTDSLGNYSFTGLTLANNYRITASYPGYTTASNTNINVTSGASITSNLTLAVSARGRIYGKVGVAGDSSIIINALVLLRYGSASAAISDSTRSDSTGRYAFADLIAGAPGYWLTASAPGFALDNNDSVIVIANDSTLSDFALPILVAVKGSPIAAQRLFTATRIGNEWVIRLPAADKARRFEMRDVRGTLIHKAIVPAGATQIILPATATQAGVLMRLE
jgi:hypothetical protein